MSHTEPVGCVSREMQGTLAHGPSWGRAPSDCSAPCRTLVNAWKAPHPGLWTYPWQGGPTQLEAWASSPRPGAGSEGDGTGVGASSRGAAGNPRSGVSTHWA